MENKEKEKRQVNACIRKVWKQGNKKVIGIPSDAPFEAGQTVIVLALDEGILNLPSNAESYLKVHLDNMQRH